jgi:hypothetical protein
LFGEDITAYLPENIRPFAEQLHQFPNGYEKWIYASSLPKDTYQGDVFTNVPFISLDDEGDGVRFEVSGMVVSNTCDTQPGNGDFVLIAPVIDLEDYRENNGLAGEQLESHLRALTENKISQLMFLPDASGVRPSFVDFGRICSISLRFFHSERGQKRLLSLSQCGHYFMLMKLAYHFSRPEASDAKRV